ncbi:MAG: hypothetical protein M3Q30_23250 [Actinomycetota bacterium]|nr:hypothetical protein [Actinomycetota bacterium]
MDYSGTYPWAYLNGIILRSGGNNDGPSAFAKDVMRERNRILKYKDLHPDPPIELPKAKVERLTDEFWDAHR